MWLCRITVFLLSTCSLVSSQSGERSTAPLRRIYGLHPSQRYGRTVHQIESDQDKKSRRVETWLENYQDLLGQWIDPIGDDIDQSQTTTTEPTPASSTESLLMSLLGGFLPLISGDPDDKTADTTGDDIVYDDNDRQDVLRIKRLGLAAGADDVESKRSHRRPFKRRKLRRSTTERSPSSDERQKPAREPDFKQFCRRVIRTIAANADGDNFRKVSMYQEIYYLISKYNIPVEDHQTDIVFIIDKLCKNDGSLRRNVPHIDNTIEDLETKSFVYHSSGSGEEDDANSEYSSVAKFPRFPLEAPTTSSPVPTSHGVYVSQLGEQFPAGFVKHRDFLFYPTQSDRTESPSVPSSVGAEYPRVVYSGPVDSHHSQENNDDLTAPVATEQQSTEKSGDVIEPITLYPNLDIDNVKSVSFLDHKPQDILVASTLSFGEDSLQGTGISPGKETIPDTSNHRVEDDRFDDTVVKHSTPTEFVSSTTEPPLRKGTVEDIPAHRPTLPPVVKTSKIEIENSRNPSYLDHINSISSTANPPFIPTTFKTSKLRGGGRYKAQPKPYTNYLQTVIEDFYEEPARSLEEPESPPDYVRSGYKKHYAPASTPGFFPRQREPYPYKNMPRPLPYLSPPRPHSRSGPPRGRYPPRDFDREDLMGNKMDDQKLIDGYIENQGGQQRSDFTHHLNQKKHKVTVRPATQSPRLQALTLKQLSAGLSVTTARPESVDGMGATRDYTVFDMADAVTVTHPPNPELERLNNHQTEVTELTGGSPDHQVHRPHFQTYSETAPARISTKHAGVLDDFNTLRPDYIEYDQSPSPANNHEQKLMVDLSTSYPDNERPKRNVSIDDLLFLYNITFLTDSKEITPSIGGRTVIDHNINLNEAKEEEQYLDYSSLPLPDYQALDTEDKFNDALEEFLKDYDAYSYEQLNEDQADDDIEDVEKILSEIIGDGPLSGDLLGDVFHDDDYYQYDILDDGDVEDSAWSAGHRVNHRTHSVPEFANQLISQKREGSAQSAASSTPSATALDTVNLSVAGQTAHHNHQPFYGLTDRDVSTSSKEGIKEVLMVLNATGKAKPKNRTRAYDGSNEFRDGYYPEQGETEEFTDQVDKIDDDIENVHSGHMNDDTSRDAVQFEFSEQENDINNNDNHIQNSETKMSVDDESETDKNTDDKLVVEEKKFFYPVSSEKDNTAQEVSTENDALNHENLSDLIDSWDSHSDEIISNDEFISELEKEKLEKAALEAELAANSLYEPDNSENFPLKSFISDSDPDLNSEQDISAAEDSGINPEKLAYILIGVCCGLSIICLIVVAISIGYKSETHYRLEEPRRKHIRLLKANNSDEDSNSSSSEQDDKSRAKLGNWFTGKNHIETMDRKSKLVFPTSVYLDNLASSASHSTMSRSNASGSSSPSVGSEKNVNMFEVERGDDKCDPGDSIEVSEASLSSIKTDPSKPYDADSLDLHLDQGSKKKQFMKAHKNKSSYNLSSSKLYKGEQNLSQVGLSEAQDKFRYKSQTPSGRRNSNVTVKSNVENSREYSETEITWSENTDRLI